MSRPSHKELFDRFQTITRWMTEDIERSIFDAKANFLVAQGLLNYTEIVGSFITGKEDSGENFDTFFGRMGDEYSKLLKNHNRKGKRANRKPHVVYDDLRCGLTHEYLPKRKGFLILGSDDRAILEQFPQAANYAGVSIAIDCGVKHARIQDEFVWVIINAKYYFDFKKALDEYKMEIVNNVNTKNFYNRAKNIKLVRFGK